MFSQEAAILVMDDPLRVISCEEVSRMCFLFHFLSCKEPCLTHNSGTLVLVNRDSNHFPQNQKQHTKCPQYNSRHITDPVIVVPDVNV